MRIWRVDDVMTTSVVTVPSDATYRSMVNLLIRHRFSALPVVDEGVRVVGVVSEADLLRKVEYSGNEEPRLFEGRQRRGERGKALAGTAADLMSSPPVVAPTGTTITDAARLMDVQDVKRLPVVDERGRLIGMVTRSDLLKVHLRPDDEINQDVMDDVLGGSPAAELRQVRADTSDGVVTLTGRVDRWSTADMVVRLTRQVAGVVRVTDLVEYDVHDRHGPYP